MALTTSVWIDQLVKHLYTQVRLHILLSLSFTSMLTHGYLPKYTIDSVMPLVKNKHGILSDKENYRLIALASEFLLTSECQFDF